MYNIIFGIRVFRDELRERNSIHPTSSLAIQRPLYSHLSPVAVQPPTSGCGYKATYTVVRSR